MLNVNLTDIATIKVFFKKAAPAAEITAGEVKEFTLNISGDTQFVSLLTKPSNSDNNEFKGAFYSPPEEVSFFEYTGRKETDFANLLRELCRIGNVPFNEETLSTDVVVGKITKK